VNEIIHFIQGLCFVFVRLPDVMLYNGHKYVWSASFLGIVELLCDGLQRAVLVRGTGDEVSCARERERHLQSQSQHATRTHVHTHIPVEAHTQLCVSSFSFGFTKIDNVNYQVVF